MLTALGVPILRWLDVTVCHLHTYVHAWSDVLGVSTSGQGPIRHSPVPDGDRLVPDRNTSCHWG